MHYGYKPYSLSSHSACKNLHRAVWPSTCPYMIQHVSCPWHIFTCFYMPLQCSYFEHKTQLLNVKSEFLQNMFGTYLLQYYGIVRVQLVRVVLKCKSGSQMFYPLFLCEHSQSYRPPMVIHSHGILSE